MIKFEIGKEYYTRSICDHECIYTIKIVSRSPKTIVYEYDGDTRRSKIHVDERQDCEFIRPDRYSMAPTFHADDPVLEEPEVEAVEEHSDESTVLLFIGEAVVGNYGCMVSSREGRIVGFTFTEATKFFDARHYAVIEWEGYDVPEYVLVSDIHQKGWVSANGSGIGVFIA